jgi:hypothetical protein
MGLGMHAARVAGLLYISWMANLSSRVHIGPTLVATAPQPGQPPGAVLYDASSKKRGLVCMQ